MTKVTKQSETNEMHQLNVSEDESEAEQVIVPALPTKRKKTSAIMTTMTPVLVNNSAPKRRKPTQTIIQDGFDIVLEDVESDNESFQHRMKIGNITQGNYNYYIFFTVQEKMIALLSTKTKTL